MRVLYLTMNPNRASTTVPTEGWFRFLPSVGLEPILASNTVGEFHAWAVQQAIPAYHVPLPFPNKWYPAPFAKSLWLLRQVVRRHRVELIHCNEQDVYPIGQYLARICRLPVVVSVHFTMSRGFCDWAFRGNRQPNRMFFVSHRNRDACSEALRGIVPQDRWHVLHNGLDMRSYRPDQQLRAQFRRDYDLRDELLIGVACALRPRKQLEHLFEAAARLQNVKVAVAGAPVSGDEDYARQLLVHGRKLLGDRLIVVGHLNDLRGFCNGLDLFVNTSREESFGVAALEAMACGCPVIGYDSKAVDEVVLPDGGEIVTQDAIDELTDALNRWLSNPDRLLSSRPHARQQAERFDLRQLSLQLWDEYQDVMSMSHSSYHHADVAC